MYIFLSHASKEHAAAEELCQLLENSGHRCFLAPRDIRSGHEYAEEIIDGIERADAMVLLLSEAANSSPHVLREIERAVSKKIKIVVYQLEQVELSKSMEYFLMSHQWVNQAANTGYESIVACIGELEHGEQVPDTQDRRETVSQKQGTQPKENSGFQAVLKKYRRLIIALIIIIFLAVLAEDIIRLKQNPENKGNIPGTEQQGFEQHGQSESQEQPENVTNQPEQAAPKADLGDTIVFGTYNGEPIEWRVLKLNGDGTAVVVSSRILTMKAFDAAESGKYNTSDGTSYWMEPVKDLEAELQQSLRGSSQWSTSNIRTWLNSEKENVTYADQAPKSTAMSELVNGYDMEPGFLSGFSKEELAAIVTASVTTGDTVSEDKVFLLSQEELSWFTEADVSRISVPTESAISQDKTGWYQMFSLDFGVSDYYWWLRDAVETETGPSAYEVYVVGNSYAEGQLISKSAGLEGFGIRPAVTIDLTADCIKVKDGETQ